MSQNGVGRRTDPPPVPREADVSIWYRVHAGNAGDEDWTYGLREECLVRNVCIDMIYNLRIKVMDVPEHVSDDLVYAVARVVCDIIENPVSPELMNLSASDFDLQMDESSFRKLVDRIARSTYIEELDSEFVYMESRPVTQICLR